MTAPTDPLTKSGWRRVRDGVWTYTRDGDDLPALRLVRRRGAYYPETNRPSRLDGRPVWLPIRRSSGRGEVRFSTREDAFARSPRMVER